MIVSSKPLNDRSEEGRVCALLEDLLGSKSGSGRVEVGDLDGASLLEETDLGGRSRSTRGKAARVSLVQLTLFKIKEHTLVASVG